MTKKKQQRATTAKDDKIDALMIERTKYAARLRRTEHEAGELRARLDALAWQARRHTPPSIRDHTDLWVVAMEAMAERARYVQSVANGSRP